MPNELEVSHEARFDAPAEQIWALVDELPTLGQWFAFTERFELLDGADVEHRQRMHNHWGHRRSEIDQKIVVWEPSRTLT